MDFEDIVRKIIVESLKSLPETNNNMLEYLKQLFDVCDQTRAQKLLNDFGSIKDKSEKRRCVDQIAKSLSYPEIIEQPIRLKERRISLANTKSLLLSEACVRILSIASWLMPS